MKKMINWSIAYLIAGLAGGVFYREFTKLTGFSGTTTLSVVHVHLLVLGMLLCLLLGIFCNITTVQEQPWFTRGSKLYHGGLIFTVSMLIARGVLQVLGAPLSSGMDAAISGLAGLGHIVLSIGLVSIMVALRKSSKS